MHNHATNKTHWAITCGLSMDTFYLPYSVALSFFPWKKLLEWNCFCAHGTAHGKAARVKLEGGKGVYAAFYAQHLKTTPELYEDKRSNARTNNQTSENEESTSNPISQDLYNGCKNPAARVHMTWGCIQCVRGWHQIITANKRHFRNKICGKQWEFLKNRNHINRILLCQISQNIKRKYQF